MGFQIAKVLHCKRLLKPPPLLITLALLGERVEYAQIGDDFAYCDLIHYLVICLSLQALLPRLRRSEEAQAVLAWDICLASVSQRLHRVPLDIFVTGLHHRFAFCTCILVRAAVAEKVRHKKLIWTMEMESGNQSNTKRTQCPKETTDICKKVQKAVDSTIVVLQVM